MCDDAHLVIHTDQFRHLLDPRHTVKIGVGAPGSEIASRKGVGAGCLTAPLCRII